MKAIKRVFLDTLPVMTGYLFLGIGFGILLQQQAEKGFTWSAAMGIFVFAGSAQYLTVGLLAAGASLASTALAVFLLNARHIFYGISLVDTYKDFKGKPYLIFALTDETYSLVTQNQPPEGMSKNKYCLLVSALDHSYWILGCCLGALVGNLIPINYEGVEFVLTAMFVTLLTEQWLTNKNHTAAILGVVCTALSLFLLGKEYFLIPAMVLIAISLLVLQKTGRRDRHA